MSTAVSDTATHRYGHAPQSMFAATRMCAERRARGTAAAAAAATASRSPQGLFLRLVATLPQGAWLRKLGFGGRTGARLTARASLAD